MRRAAAALIQRGDETGMRPHLVQLLFEVATLTVLSCGDRVFLNPIATDQVVRRAVVTERGLRRALELRDDSLGQHLAQFDAPLIERVDVPDDTLCEHAV